MSVLTLVLWMIVGGIAAYHYFSRGDFVGLLLYGMVWFALQLVNEHF
jgi:hypothetical protein